MQNGLDSRSWLRFGKGFLMERVASSIYVLQAFQKKSKTGIAIPRSEIELIRQRLKRAIELRATLEKSNG